MIDLYALTSPNVQKIYIMLEETKLPYKEHFVDVWKGEQYNPNFIKINPNSKIPAIVDHEGPGGKPYTVFESGAILMYLAEKTGKFLPQDMTKRYEVLQMADVPGHRRRADVRSIHLLQAVLAKGQGQFLFDVALSDRSETALRSFGKAVGALTLSRRRRIFDRRHRDFSVDAQS